MGGSPAAVDNFCTLRNEAGTPVYAYQFAHELPDDEAGSHDMKGAFHSSELWFMFKSLEHSDRPFTDADWELAEHVISCWTDFAKTGNPGNGWNAYSQEKPEFMVFDLDENNTKDASVMRRPIVKNQQ
ncbi:MAG: carboxylesterase family protein [Bacteroidia bacterium]|nr:carboxylesterase family protein [Bacteroidia bacterium]